MMTTAVAARRIGAKGIALIQSFEGCGRKLSDGRCAAYPDPGSRDGHPWTIGWGATGEGIRAGIVWTQAQCDERLISDLVAVADEVGEAIGAAPTSQCQFDAMVSFHYNTGAIARATLTRKHIEGNYLGAAREFARWIYNDGRPLPGLVARRAAEAALYAGAA